MKIRKPFILFLLLPTLLLAACASTNPLEDTSWNLETLNGQAPLPDTQPSLNFENDMLSGSDGCNHISGGYTLQGGNFQIGDNLASTLMACPEPIMQQASTYINALLQATRYTLTGAQLTLLDANGKVLAVFSQNLSNDASARGSTNGIDPQNATYLVEGEAVTLTNGRAEKELVPGAASSQVTTYFGNAVEIDLNSDGLVDTAFLLVQEGNGTGTFFYITAALQTADGIHGTNAIFLGDRIAPQTTMIDPGDPSRLIVSYGERAAGEPMTSQATVMVTRTFTIENGILMEVPPTQTP